MKHFFISLIFKKKRPILLLLLIILMVKSLQIYSLYSVNFQMQKKSAVNVAVYGRVFYLCNHLSWHGLAKPPPHTAQIGTIHILRQQNDWAMVGWVGLKMDSFADVQYRIFADKMGGSEKVIYGWSLVQMVLITATHSSEKTVRAKQRVQRPGQKFEFESGASATFKTWWGQAYVICPFQQCTWHTQYTPNHPVAEAGS